MATARRAHLQLQICADCIAALQRRHASTSSSSSNPSAFGSRISDSSTPPSTPQRGPPGRNSPTYRRDRPSSIKKAWSTHSYDSRERDHRPPRQPSTSTSSSGTLTRRNQAPPMSQPQAIQKQDAKNQNPRSWQSASANKVKPGTEFFREKEGAQPKQVNFSQGSALSALLSKNKKASSSQSPSPPIQSTPTPTQQKKKQQTTTTKKSRFSRGKVEISSVMSVSNLARALDMKLRRLQLLMERMGMPDTRPDRLLNSEDASLIAIELGYDAVVDDQAAFDIYPAPPPDTNAILPLRPPIVTIMGHVDHGKTSLLDALRSTAVAAGEAGGITQHIGAFSVPLSSLLSNQGESSSSTTEISETSAGSITFLDTPGHAAFTAMRSRGASVTDVVVLVVAADDGVKPQTEEVVKLIKNEDVGIVVAITKCDKPGIDISRVHNELLALGLETEALGGDIPAVEVSAHTGAGLPTLVETLNAVAEVRDLRSERDNIPSEGRVIESHVDKGKGNVATVIVTRGTLSVGNLIIAGTCFGRVRTLINSEGKLINQAGPGQPVEVTGWKEIPTAGDEVLEANSEEDAKKAIENRKRRKEKERTIGDLEIINEKRRIESEALSLQKQLAEEAIAEGASREEIANLTRPTNPTNGNEDGKLKELRLIIKADFSGTVEAVSASLSEIGNSEAKVKVVSTGVGDVTDGDLTMAKAVDGVIIGFNIRASRPMLSTASLLGVPILINDIIYRLIDEVKERVIDLLPKQYDHRVLGEATVLQIFQYKVKGQPSKAIAGCRVTNGTLNKKAKIRVIRDKEVVYEGAVGSLKHHKAEVEEMRKGNECGLAIENFEDVKEGDTLQSFEEILRTRTL